MYINFSQKYWASYNIKLSCWFHKSNFLLEIQILVVGICRHTTFYMTCRLSTNRRYFPLLSHHFAHQSSGQTMSFEKTRFVPHSVIYFPTTYCLYGFYPVAFYMGITNVLYLLLLCRGHRATNATNPTPAFIVKRAMRDFHDFVEKFPNILFRPMNDWGYKKTFFPLYAA